MPPPLKADGPVFMIGGGSAAAARRAARHGLGFVAQGNPPELAELYAAECRAHGHEPGIARFTNPDAPTGMFVADDVYAVPATALDSSGACPSDASGQR